MRRAARNLAISSKKSRCELKKNERRGAKLIHIHPALKAGFNIREAVGKREGQLLHGRGARLADVIPADRDGIPLRHLARAVLDHVGHDPHGRTGRIDPLFLGDVLFKDVRLDRPPELGRTCTFLFGDHNIERQCHRGRRIDRHGGGDVLQRDPAKEYLHIGERTDGHAADADLPFRQGDRRNRDPSTSADQTRQTGRSDRGSTGSGSARWCLPVCRTRRTAASSRGVRGTWWDGSRGCTDIPREHRWPSRSPDRRWPPACTAALSVSPLTVVNTVFRGSVPRPFARSLMPHLPCVIAAFLLRLQVTNSSY